jgi:hypothetical protein
MWKKEIVVNQSNSYQEAPFPSSKSNEIEYAKRKDLKRRILKERVMKAMA